LLERRELSEKIKYRAEEEETADEGHSAG